MFGQSSGRSETFMIQIGHQSNPNSPNNQYIAFQDPISTPFTIIDVPTRLLEILKHSISPYVFVQRAAHDIISMSYQKRRTVTQSHSHHVYSSHHNCYHYGFLRVRHPTLIQIKSRRECSTLCHAREGSSKQTKVE